MQSYIEIPSSQTLQSSLALLLSNDKTALSQSSGTAFPTTNLQVGMPCFRTDLNKIYVLKNLTPTWILAIDLSSTAALIASATNLAGGTAGGIPYQSGAGATSMVAAGTPGYVLTSGGAEVPVWVAQSTIAVAWGNLAGKPSTIAGMNFTDLATTTIGTATNALSLGGSLATNYAQLAAAQTYSAPQKAAIVPNAASLAVDLSAAGNDYSITPTAGGTIVFSNIAANAGKSGNIILTNTANYALAKGANIKCPSTLFTTISATGDYWVSYHCDGTTVRLGCGGANT